MLVNIINSFIRIIPVSLMLAAGLTLSACDNGGGNNRKEKPSTPVSDEQIKSAYVDMAYAAYSDSLTAAQNLQTAVTTFLAEPNETLLNAAKSAYKQLRPPYQQSEILRWDTDITLGTNTGAEGITSVDEWEGQVNAWPLAEGLIDYTAEDATNNIIAGSDTIDEAFLVSQNGLNDDEANVATGIHAIEFLLWGQDLNGTGPGAGERPATDYDTTNCSNGNCDRRAQYLRTATQILVDDLSNMQAEWSDTARTTEGTLAYNFLNSDKALAYILSSLKIMSDDELASARMGTALETGDPEEEHDCFSDLSHVAIYHNFQGIKNAFYGDYGTLNGVGVADRLLEIDATLYQRVESLINDIEDRMADILNQGEAQTDTLRFDQIIALGEGDPAFDNANQASLALIELGLEFDLVREALLIEVLGNGGGGDGD